MSVLCLSIQQSCNEHRFHTNLHDSSTPWRKSRGHRLFHFDISEYSSYIGYIKVNVTTNEPNCKVPLLSPTILLQDFIICLPRRVSYKNQEWLTLRELVAYMFVYFGGVRGAHLFSFLCCILLFCLASSCVFCSLLLVSRDCPFLVVTSVFSNVYFL